MCVCNHMCVAIFRFLFILLGPMGKGPQYHEIGRSIATLMTDEVSIVSQHFTIYLFCTKCSIPNLIYSFALNVVCCTSKVFHDVAYKAKDRSDLVAGIDEFLDQVTVLPPGEWDPTIRIEPPKNVPSQVKPKALTHFLSVLNSCYRNGSSLAMFGVFIKKKFTWFLKNQRLMYM